MAKTMSDVAKRFNGETSVPKGICVFSDGLLTLAVVGDQQNSDVLRIVAYKGEVTKHWFWGNLAIDLSGLKFDKSVIPVLLEHFTADRIGFGTGRVTDEVTVEGKFLQNTQAKELQQDMRAGFPMQASMYCPPSIVEQVAEGATAQVNGHTLTGPGAVFRAATIKEVSACVFGAFSNTSSTAFADSDTESIAFELLGDSPMAKEQVPVLTVETFKAENPQIHDVVFASGRQAGSQAEQERFVALRKACGDDTALLADCFAAGLTVADALTKRNEKLAAELKSAKEQLAKPPAAGKARDAATQEFITQPPPKTESEKAVQFNEATATDDELKTHFAAAPDLRDRFSSAAAYVAHVRHPAKT